jgi:hypothetical protein
MMMIISMHAWNLKFQLGSQRAGCAGPPGRQRLLVSWDSQENSHKGVVVLGPSSLAELEREEERSIDDSISALDDMTSEWIGRY